MKTDREVALLLQEFAWSLIPTTFLYGIYTILFIQCLRTLKRSKRYGYKYWIGATSTLFILSTVFMINLGYSYTLLESIGGVVIFRVTVAALIFLVSDLIIIWRCYLVWGKRKLMLGLVLLPFFTIIITAIFYLNISQEMGGVIFYGVGAVTNILVTCLTAGRIWWTHRISKRLLRHEVLKRYIFALNLVLESGLITVIYLSVSLVINTIVVRTNSGLEAQYSQNTALVIANESIREVQVILTALLPTAMLLRVAKGYDSAETIERINLTIKAGRWVELRKGTALA